MMTITESSFEHNGMTFITVAETDNEGNTVCSGCKEVLVNPIKAYSQGITIDDKTRKFYSVHKYCNASSPN